MGKYYVKFGLSKNFNAGSKAMKDIMALLESNGYKPVLALPARMNKFLKLVDIPILLFTILFKVGSKGTIVYFIPSNAQRIRFIKFLKDVLGFRLICFINDVESMRMNKSKKYAVDEMKSIASSDVVLVPNKFSVHILSEQYGLKNKLVPVEVWDYLVCDKGLTEKWIESVEPSPNVAYAGNLNLAPFIDELSKVDLQFKIWGSKKVRGKEKNVEFMGEESPEELIGLVAECSWGMVWYGFSTENFDSPLSSYLRFCNSHKCGLYLAAGVPLIVWQESGMAFFVDKYQVGIAVSSLREAATIINSMDDHTYAGYRRNAKKMGAQIRQGKFFLRALTVAEELCK